MAMWNQWRGCHKCSEGCRYCYIHKGDMRRGKNTDVIRKSNKFFLPIQKDKNGNFKIKSGKTVYLCFSTDFLIEDADLWRDDCWDIMKKRQDLKFIFLTKRIDRFFKCIPRDWGSGYDNVVIGCTVENQNNADYRLSVFDKLPIKHKNIICQPFIERVDLSEHLQNVELVVVRGESDRNARILNYDWVLKIRQQCIENGVNFQFRQLGTNFEKDGRLYKIKTNRLFSQARKADIDWYIDKDS